MTWFIIYILITGIYLATMCNIVVRNLDWSDVEHKEDLEELRSTMHRIGLTPDTLKYILPHLTILCLLFGWLFVPIAIIQEILGKLGIKL